MQVPPQDILWCDVRLALLPAIPTGGKSAATLGWRG